MADGNKKGGWSGTRSLGICLLVVAAVVLFLPERIFGAFGVFVFIALLLPGFFLVTGLAGTPADVVRLRREVAQQSGKGAPPAIDITPRVLRYHIASCGMVALVIMAAGFLIGGVALGVLLWQDPRSGSAGHGFALGMGGFLSGFGILALLYLYRTSHIGIQVDNWGLKAQTLFGKAEMAWQDVIALKALDITNVGMGTGGSVYRVYSASQTLEFYDRLQGAPELVALIEQATAMTWG